MMLGGNRQCWQQDLKRMRMQAFPVQRVRARNQSMDIDLILLPVLLPRDVDQSRVKQPLLRLPLAPMRTR